jgi:hypothetical protein
MNTLKLQYLIILLNIYNYISIPDRERIKCTCKKMFNVHTLECFITVIILLTVLILATLLGVDIITIGASAGGSVLGGITLVIIAWTGIPWCILIRVRLWRWTMDVMAEGGVL